MADREIFLHPEAFTNWAFETAPYRYTDGYSGWAFTFVPGLVNDTVAQLRQDLCTLHFHKLGPQYSPNDYLGEIGSNFGLLKFPVENNDDFRARIATKWDFVREYGQTNKLQTMLESSLSGSYTVRLEPKVIGEENYIAPPVSAGLGIYPYPSYNTNPFQFNVYFQFQTIIGSGSYSNIVTDEQWASIRETIRLVKPVTWACREIVFTYNPDNLVLWDGAHDWDEAGITYYDDNVLTGSFFQERHAYQVRL